MTFGLALPKKEGGKLFPTDYLLMNGSLPTRSMYTAEELEEHKQWGDDLYRDESLSNS